MMSIQQRCFSIPINFFCKRIFKIEDRPDNFDYDTSLFDDYCYIDLSFDQFNQQNDTNNQKIQKQQSSSNNIAFYKSQQNRSVNSLSYASSIDYEEQQINKISNAQNNQKQQNVFSQFSNEKKKDGRRSRKILSKEKKNSRKYMKLSKKQKKQLELKKQKFASLQKYQEFGKMPNRRWSAKETRLFNVIVACIGNENCSAKRVQEIAQFYFPLSKYQAHKDQLRSKIGKQWGLQGAVGVKNWMYDVTCQDVELLKEICNKWRNQDFKGFTEEEIQQYLQKIQ